GFITVLLLQIYVNSANEIWWGGGSFSNRRLAEYSFIFMAGLATLFKDERRFRVWIVPAAVMALWTLLLVIAERCGNLTLAHYVPWKADFLKNVFGSLAGPWPASLSGDFGGVDISGRICATVCLGLLFAGLLIITARKSIIHDCSIQAAGGLLIAVTLVVLITAAAALRTRPLSPDEAEGYYRENRFLWGNYYEYGYYLVNKGRLPEALKAYENAVNLLPERPQPYRYIGTIYEASGDWDRAEHYYREALKISPDYTQARMLLEGLALRRLGIPDSPEGP
ncbi:MAG TPA: tetratricopeptide repeat protein, partial [Candidatus Sumerlaeota bacterium]|nr:tetratricopeptide repeat protein [Candidatus Sumerlaeota bacterium]